jgi:hypothetical protein
VAFQLKTVQDSGCRSLGVGIPGFVALIDVWPDSLDAREILGRTSNNRVDCKAIRLGYWRATPEAITAQAFVLTLFSSQIATPGVNSG